MADWTSRLSLDEKVAKGEERQELNQNGGRTTKCSERPSLSKGGRHSFAIEEQSKGEEKDRRDEKGKGTEKRGSARGTHQTLGEPVWLTRRKVEIPRKATRAKIAKNRGSSEPVWHTGRPACHLMRR